MKQLISRHRLILAAAAGALSCALTASGAAAPTAERTAAVTIHGFSFVPATLTVPPGTRVTWTNRDDETHAVVSGDAAKTFQSSALDTGDTFSFVFGKPGTYRYFCSLHPYMQGTVIVQ